MNNLDLVENELEHWETPSLEWLDVKSIKGGGDSSDEDVSNLAS